ncbi:MAG: hypothetical protein HYW47_00300 [Deltaproteobacteria bacterium]|nr:hypothetical protein [Deltaproteobacteria bacterium]
MKKVFVVLGLVVLCVTQMAQAAFRPDWERPLAHARMDIQNAHGDFENAIDAQLTLHQRDDAESPTSMTLTYYDKNSHELIVEKHPIITTNEVDCGSVEYTAQLIAPQPLRMNSTMEVMPVDPYEAKRFSIHLVDHTDRTCKDLKPFKWEAHVREGFGWCGTFDSTMDLLGNPHTIYTIATTE